MVSPSNIAMPQVAHASMRTHSVPSITTPTGLRDSSLQQLPPPTYVSAEAYPSPFQVSNQVDSSFFPPSYVSTEGQAYPSIKVSGLRELLPPPYVSRESYSSSVTDTVDSRLSSSSHMSTEMYLSPVEFHLQESSPDDNPIHFQRRHSSYIEAIEHPEPFMG